MSQPVLKFDAPLTIGVVADTHVYAGGRRRLPAEVIELFERAGVGLVLHAGDVNDRTVLDQLGAVARLLAVTGNNDSPDLLDRLPAVIRFRVGRFSFVLVHGHQGRTARAVARTYAGHADCVVYGHSHIPKLEEVAGTVLLNPGSPTDRRWGPHFGIGLIRVGADRAIPELLLFSNPAHLTAIDVSPKPGRSGTVTDEFTISGLERESRSDDTDAN